MLHFTSEFGMDSGGSKALWSPSKNGDECMVTLIRNLSFAADRSHLNEGHLLTPFRFGGKPIKKGERSLWCYMVKPHEQLVPVSSTPHSAYTPGLSTSWSRTALQALKEQGNLILKGASRLDAFSGYPVRT